MTDLYRRILLWHKLLAMQTGGLALCSARHKLNRDEAKGWSDAARNVADDIDTFLHTGAFILDDRGQRVVQFDHREGTDQVTGSKAIAPRGLPQPEGNPHLPEASDEVNDPTIPNPQSKAVSPTKTAGGLRVATRRRR